MHACKHSMHVTHTIVATNNDNVNCARRKLKVSLKSSALRRMLSISGMYRCSSFSRALRCDENGDITSGLEGKKSHAHSARVTDFFKYRKSPTYVHE